MLTTGDDRSRLRLVPRIVVAVRRRRREADLVAGLADMLDSVAAGFRAGTPPLMALAEAGAGGDVPPALADDLARVVERAGQIGFGPALTAWAGDRPLPAVRAVAAALQVTIGAGGPGAGALEGLAAAQRDRHDAAAEVAALSAQARLSAVVVGAAPVASLLLSVLADRRVAPTLISTAAGRLCLVTGLGLEGLATVWMRRIVRCDP
jgi:tight adherence protein B